MPARKQPRRTPRATKPRAHGGRRVRAGRPTGSVTQKTREKVQELEVARQLVYEHLAPMMLAQIQHAKGINHIYKRLKNGKFERVVDAEEILRLLNDEGEGSLQVFVKDPSSQSFKELMDRAFGKPTEDVKVEHAGGIRLTWQS